jgi:hypothetical protein
MVLACRGASVEDQLGGIHLLLAQTRRRIITIDD